MKKVFLSLLAVICVAITTLAQDKSLYKKELFIVNSDTLPYRILLPLNYDATKKYPLICVLHGAGERGNDNEAQLVHGAGLFLKDSIRQNYPAIVVFPQCPSKSFWPILFSNRIPPVKEVLSFRQKVIQPLLWILHNNC
jgi:predicted peptidase